MIDEREDKTRLKCPHCGAFIAEIKPRLEYGQSVVARCPRCRSEVEIKKAPGRSMS